MPFRTHPSGLTVTVRLTPNARQEEVHGYVNLEDGKKALKISVRAPPEDGRANKALIDLVAKSWKIPKSSISIFSGQTSRVKVVLLEGNGAEIKKKIEELLL